MLPKPQHTAKAGGIVEVYGPGGGVRRIALRGSRMVIGRAPESDIHLDRPSISRRHAELMCDPMGRWWVRDLGGRKGVKVNGKAVRQAALGPRDVCRIGRFRLKLQTAGGAGGLLDTLPSPAAVRTEETLDAEISTLGEAPASRIDTMHVSTLTEFGERLVAVEQPRERRRLLCRLLVRKDFRGLCAMVLRIEKRRPRDPVLVLHSQSAHLWRDEGTYVSRKLINALRQTHGPVLANNTSPMPGGVEVSLSPKRGILAAVACPLREDEQTLDFIYVVLPTEYGNAQWLALTSLAAKQYQQAEAAWAARLEAQAHAAIEHELASARRIQQRLVPQHVAIDGLDIAIHFQPCHWIGGDYVDAFRLRDGRALLLVADVSGHGLPAALIAQSIHSMVHVLMDTGAELSDMVDRLNQYCCRFLDEASFVTMAAALMDVDTGQFTHVNAGHPPAVVVSPDGAAKQLEGGGHLPLGVEPMTVKVGRGQLERGHMIAIVSDGVLEVEDQSQTALGHDSLVRQIVAIHSSNPINSMAGVAQRLAQFVGSIDHDAMPRDDRSFMLVTRT